MNEEYYINLIYKSLDLEISPNQAEELALWRAHSSKNEMSYQAVLTAWHLTESPANDLKLDLDIEFAALEMKIEEDNSEEYESDAVITIARTPKRYPRMRLLLVAATITLLVGLSFVFQWMQDDGLEWIKIESGNQTMMVMLPDSSSVNLNANSSLKYPKAFAENERKVFLKGEGFFEVQPNPKKAFMILTAKEHIKVLGTSFNIRAYKEEKKSSVFVLTGVVEFGSKDGDKVKLNAGDEAIYNQENDALNVVENRPPNAISWISKQLMFVNSPVNEVVLELEQLYNVQIDIDKLNNPNCPFSGKFREQSLESSLEVLSLVFEIEISKINENTYELIGGRCDIGS